MLDFADNITRLRHNKKLTQGELAEIMGVTKASVSKWENGQSLPDILLLPQIATYFDITIDELLGYKPQLSREQIQKLYIELAGEFAKDPFEEVIKKSRRLVKKYYSCYEFLLKIGILWLNHMSLAKSEEDKQQLLNDMEELCVHVLEDCKDVKITSDAQILKLMTDLNRGMAFEVAEQLEEINDKTRLSNQSVSMLIQAYQMSGKIDKASEYSQVDMLFSIIAIITDSMQYISLNMTDIVKCEEVIKRTMALIELYKIDKVHPNSVAQFYYQTALFWAQAGKSDNAIEQLEAMVSILKYMLDGEIILIKGDGFFDKLEGWLEKEELNVGAPRDKKIVEGDIKNMLEHPVFNSLNEDKRFKRIKKIF